MAVPKSWKTVEIMQQCKFGFTMDYVNQLCSEWQVIKDYAYILHDKDKKEDGSAKENHIHLMLRFNSAVPTSAILSKLQGVCEVQQLQKMHSWNSAIAYLTHANDLSKHQYEEEDVKSNFDWQSDRDKALASKGRLDTIINGINDGVIREFNYTEHISMSEYTKYKRQIDTAFKYRLDRLEGANRMMECLFLTGDSGTGKTSFAKYYCEKNEKSYFVSSGSNDPFDNYKGQQVIILDDMRPESTGLSDLLKLLDNHTASSVKSRYRNKVLECDAIIITTTLSLSEFFNRVYGSDRESIVQLKRRVTGYFEFNKDTYKSYLYNNETQHYDFIFELDNPSKKYRVETMSAEEKMERMKKLLGNAAEGYDRLAKNLEHYTGKSTLEEVNIDEELPL